MYGGSASSGGRWSLGAKTYRAPTEGERIREAQDRLARESERRKLHVRLANPPLLTLCDLSNIISHLQEIKHEERHIRKQQRLQRDVRFNCERVSAAHAHPFHAHRLRQSTRVQ